MLARIFKITFGVLVIAGVCFGLNAIREKKESEPEPEIIRPVRTMILHNGSDDMIRNYFGTVQGGKRADLSFRVSGTLRKILVEKGASVVKGQLLATLDPRDFNTRVSQAQSTQAQAQAQLNDAQANFKRYENLYKQKVVPRATYDTYKTQLDVAKSALNTAAAQVKSARDALKDTELRAPFNGVIADRAVENFQDVTAKQTVFSLQDISTLEIVFNVPDNDVLLAPLPKIHSINELKKHSDAITINARFDAIPDKIFPLEIKEVATKANAATNTYPATAVMTTQSDVIILPGMAVKVEAKFLNENANHDTNKFSVPSTAILNQGENNYVWLYDNGLARKIPVKLANMNNDASIEISGENLKNGDIIITAGVYFLHDAQKVRILESGE